MELFMEGQQSLTQFKIRSLSCFLLILLHKYSFSAYEVPWAFLSYLWMLTHSLIENSPCENCCYYSYLPTEKLS